MRMGMCIVWYLWVRVLYYMGIDCMGVCMGIVLYVYGYCMTIVWVLYVYGYFIVWILYCVGIALYGHCSMGMGMGIVWYRYRNVT